MRPSSGHAYGFASSDDRRASPRRVRVAAPASITPGAGEEEEAAGGEEDDGALPPADCAAADADPDAGLPACEADDALSAGAALDGAEASDAVENGLRRRTPATSVAVGPDERIAPLAAAAVDGTLDAAQRRAARAMSAAILSREMLGEEKRACF